MGGFRIFFGRVGVVREQLEDILLGQIGNTCKEGFSLARDWLFKERGVS